MWSGSEKSEEYGLEQLRQIENTSEGSSCHSINDLCTPEQNIEGRLFQQEEEGGNLSEQILRQKKKRRKSEENYDAGTLIENQTANLPAFDLFNYGFSVEQETPILKAKKQNLNKGQVKPQSLKITPFLCNKAGIKTGAPSPFSNYSIKSKKLLNFTEKANEVISERNRVPRKQNLQLLKKKLLTDEDDEQFYEENDGYLDEQIKPLAFGHFNNHKQFKGSIPKMQKGGKPELQLQLSQHLLQLPNVSQAEQQLKYTSDCMVSPSQSLNSTARLKTSKSNDNIPLPVNQDHQLDENGCQSAAMLQLRKQQSSGDKSHFFVMSLNKSNSRDNLSLSCSAQADTKTKYAMNNDYSSRQSVSNTKQANQNAESSKKRLSQPVYNNFTFKTIKNGNTELTRTSRNKGERIPTGITDTVEEKFDKISDTISPLNKKKKSEDKGQQPMFAQQKSIVKKNFGKMGGPQTSGGYSKQFNSAKQAMLRQSHGDLFLSSSKKLQNSDKQDSLNAYAMNSSSSKFMPKPTLNSYGHSNAISKSHSKFNMSANNNLNAVTKVPNMITNKKSNIALKTVKTALPYQMALNSPMPNTKLSKYNGMLSGSPLRRAKSPTDRSTFQNTDKPRQEVQVENSVLSLNQSKSTKNGRMKKNQPPQHASFRRSTTNQNFSKSRFVMNRKSGQLHSKATKQQLVTGLPLSPNNLHGNSQFSYVKVPMQSKQEAQAFADDQLIQFREGTKMLKHRSKSDVKYRPGKTQRSSTHRSSVLGSAESPQPYEKRHSMPGNVMIEPFLGQMFKQDAKEMYEAAHRVSRLKGTRSGSETPNMSAKNRQESKLDSLTSSPNKRHSNQVKSFPRTLSLCDRHSTTHSHASGEGLRVVKKLAETGELDFGEQKGQIRSSLVGNEMFRRDKGAAQQLKPKRLPGPEDKLVGDSLKITETKDNEDATHRSLQRGHTEELKIHETSVEELNLIADRSAVEIDETGNNISVHSSSMAVSLDDKLVNLKFIGQNYEMVFENTGTAQAQKSVAERTPGILVCEDTPPSSTNFDIDPAMVFQSDDPSPDSYRPQITITSQDFDEQIQHTQAKTSQNAPMFNLNPSNKKSFTSNREHFVNSRQHKSSLLNECAFQRRSEYQIQVSLQKSPISYKPDRDSIGQSSQNPTTDSNFPISNKVFDFRDKQKSKKPSKTFYTTSGKQKPHQSMFLNDSGKRSISSNTSNSEHPFSMQTVNSGSNSKHTGNTGPLLIDTTLKSGEYAQPQTMTCVSKKTWTSSNKKTEQQAFQKKKRSTLPGQPTKPSTTKKDKNHLKLQGQSNNSQLTPSGLKDFAKSHPVSDVTSGCSTAKHSNQHKPPPATATSSAMKGRQNLTNNYYKCEEKSFIGSTSQASSKVQTSNSSSHLPMKLQMAESSLKVKQMPLSGKKSAQQNHADSQTNIKESMLEYGKQSFPPRKSTGVRSFRPTGSQQSSQNTSGNSTMPNRKPYKVNTKGSSNKLQIVNPNSQQQAQPADLRSKSVKKGLQQVKRKSTLISPKAASMKSFNLNQALKRENEKPTALTNTKNNPIQVGPLLSPQNMPLKNSNLLLPDRSLATSKQVKQRSRSNLQEAPRRKMLRQLGSLERATPTTNIDVSTPLPQTSPAKTVPMPLQNNLALQSTPQVTREPVGSLPGSALAISTQTSQISQSVQKVRTKKNIPSAQINLQDVTVSKSMTTTPEFR